MGLGESSRKSLQQSANLWVGVVLVALLVGIVNYFGWKYHKRFDWTASRLYTLTEKSEAVLGSLDRDVEAVVLFETGHELADPVSELLALPTVLSVTPNAAVRLLGWDTSPGQTRNTMDRIADDVVQADKFWNDGATGQGRARHGAYQPPVQALGGHGGRRPRRPLAQRPQGRRPGRSASEPGAHASGRAAG